MTRKYSSTSVEQLLNSSMSSSDTTLTLADSASVTALLGGVTLAGGNVDQFTIAIDPDTASEEIVFVRGISGNQLTGLVRGQAGTSAIAHTAGATVKHVLTSNDLDYYTSGITNAITAAGAATLTNKVIDASSNTLTGVATLTGSQTLTNKTLTTPINISPEERAIVSATAATGTVNFDLSTQGILYYTTNASGNFTLNFRGNSGTTLNSILTTGDVISAVFLNTNGTTAYYPTAFTIDGTSVTPKWSNGAAPSSGNASSIDAYTFTIIKTGSATYTVLAGGPVKFA